jgi:hypothetical protein
MEVIAWTLMVFRYFYLHRQKALLWGQVCGLCPRITLIGKHPTVLG